MKTSFNKIAMAFAVALMAVALPLSAQNYGQITKSARTAAAQINVKTVNGKTTLTYQGKEVWSGKTTGKVVARSKAVGDKTYAAAFDGDKMIWENETGAAKKVK